MNLEKIKDDFDFFKNDKYKKIKFIDDARTVFTLSMISLAIVSSGAIVSIFLKTGQNQDKTLPITQASAKYVPFSNSAIETSMLTSTAKIKEDKHKELQEIAKDLKDFEKKEFKNEPHATIKSIEAKNDIIKNNVLSDKVKTQLSEYGEKIKNQKFTKEDMYNMIELFEKMKKQDAAALSKIKAE